MTITDNTDASQGEAIALDFDLPHAPGKVWRALTDPVLMTEWLLPVLDFRLQTGSAFTMKAPPQPGWDGTVACRVLHIDAPRTLSYAWVVGEIDTVVTFTLAPTPAGTRLSVVQSGFKPDQKRNFGGARYGWKMMGTKLVDLLAGAP
jgi:uncharacterized protein YndB with AHSA1/START domain